LNEKVAAPVYETEINGRRDPLRSPLDTLYPQKLALSLRPFEYSKLNLEFKVFGKRCLACHS
jgi:hypothetical protein